MDHCSPPTFLLLNSLLPKNAVKLGRFVRRPLHPGEGYAPQNPTLPKHLTESSIEEDVKKLLMQDTSRGFKVALTRLLTFKFKQIEIAIKVLGTKTIITRRFLNADVQLPKLLKNPEVSKWLKMKPQINAGVVYLVVGIKTFVDARVLEGYKTGKKLDANAKLPVSELVGFFASLPDADIFDTGGRVERNNANITVSSGLSVGEQVFAIEYRPFRIAKQQLKATANLGMSTYGEGDIVTKEIVSPELRDRIDDASGSYIYGLEDGNLEMNLDGEDMDEFMFADTIDLESIVSADQIDGDCTYLYEDEVMETSVS